MKIVIHGAPITKLRARHSRKGGFMRTYDPQHKEKDRVKKEMLVAYTQALHSKDAKISLEAARLAKADNFVVNFVFHMPIQESHSQFLKKMKEWGILKHNSKPDCSNLIKFYEDCANGVFFSDDAKITSGNFVKKYSKNPRTEMEIMEKREMPLHKKVQEILSIFSLEEVRVLMQNMRCILLFEGVEMDDNMTDEARKFYLETIAYELNKFSKTYSMKINKVSKIDLPEREESKFSIYIPMEGKTLC